MDTIIITEQAAARKRKLIIYTLVIGIFIISGILLLRYSLSSSIKRGDINIATIEKGTIENTITASGEMLPEFEQVISSPVTASIQRVLAEAGSKVSINQPLLILDNAATQNQYDKIKFELASKKNEVLKLKLNLEKSFSDIESNNEIKQLLINNLMASLEDAKRLYNAGGGTREDIEKAELNLKVARLEKVQLEKEIKTRQKSMRIEMQESQIAADIQENDLKALERKLTAASITASRNGVITWINKNIGANIREGETLVRIADLGSFKVSGTVSDSYLDQLYKGMGAIIKINDNQFRGEVANINPTVQNGLISFEIQLSEKSNTQFRPNMKVEVFLITNVHNNVLRVANGPAFKGGATQQIFVLNGNKAEKRTVHTGLSNFDYVELKDNVIAGEKVIISDMTNYINAKEINIK